MKEHSPLKTVGEIARTLVALRDILGLTGWEISLSPDSADEGNLADIRTLPGRKVAILRLGADFSSRTYEAQVEDLLHELLHCCTASLSHTVEFDLQESGTLSMSSFAIFSRHFDREHELLVDHLSHALAPAVLAQLKGKQCGGKRGKGKK